MNDDLLKEFEELIEQLSVEVLRQAHLKDVADDVITQTYKAEISQSLALIDKDIDRIRQHLKTLDYISAQEIKNLLDQQTTRDNDRESRLKNVMNQNSRELYIANEKLQTQIDMLRTQIVTQTKQVNIALESHKKWLQETVKQKESYWIENSKKWLYIHYGLLIAILILVIYIIGSNFYGS